MKNGVWTEIEGAGRNSWLLTVRKSEPEPVKISHALCGFKDTTPAMVAFSENAPMLHIAAGEDPVKRQFSYHSILRQKQAISRNFFSSSSTSNIIERPPAICSRR